MSRLLYGLALVAVLLGGAGVAVENRHDPSSTSPDGHGQPLFRLALLAALESHDSGGAMTLERHPVCPDGCSVVNDMLVTAVALASLTAAVTFTHQSLPRVPVRRLLMRRALFGPPR